MSDVFPRYEKTFVQRANASSKLGEAVKANLHIIFACLKTKNVVKNQACSGIRVKGDCVH